MDFPQLTGEAFAKKPFNFLIVGGGTAGLAVAARLSEHPQLTVGVLEAGSLALGDGAVDIPGLAGRALGTHLDWTFDTAPQLGLGGRTLPYARGKVLGGSSALNYMTWNRAAREDYDDWRDLGNAGWGWDDLLSVFSSFSTDEGNQAEKVVGHSSRRARPSTSRVRPYGKQPEWGSTTELLDTTARFRSRILASSLHPTNSGTAP